MRARHLILTSFLITLCTVCAVAGEQASLPPAPKINAAIGAGWFIPFEGDLSGAPMMFLRIERAGGGEKVALDYAWSESESDVDIGGNAKSTIAQIAYMKQDGRFYYGLGMQVHSLNLVGMKKTKMMPFGVVEYPLSGGWALSFQASARTSSGGMNFGGYSLTGFRSFR